MRRHHRRHSTDGHLWQGRFKAFPIQQDEHLLTVLRYVERNPLRAKLVKRAEDWPWSSLSIQKAAHPLPPHPGPMPRPANWLEWVNEPDDPDELSALRTSVNRGAPWGSRTWVQRTAVRLGLEASLRPRGRPRKAARDISRLHSRKNDKIK